MAHLLLLTQHLHPAETEIQKSRITLHPLSISILNLSPPTLTLHPLSISILNLSPPLSPFLPHPSPSHPSPSHSSPPSLTLSLLPSASSPVLGIILARRSRSQTREGYWATRAPPPSGKPYSRSLVLAFPLPLSFSLPLSALSPLPSLESAALAARARNYTIRAHTRAPVYARYALF